MSLQEVRVFFEGYRDAFDRLDGDAVAALWHAPSAITDASGDEGRARITLWNDAAPMRDNMVRLCEAYRAAGYARATFAIEQFVALGAAHAFARLRWQLWRGDGALLQGFRTGYLLLRTGAGPRVFVVVAYDEDLDALKPDAR